MNSWEPPAIRVQSWKPEIRSGAPIAIELCCGMGAIGIGLRSLGIRVAKAYDSWNAAVTAYNHNAPEAVAVQCDLLSKDGYDRVVTDCRRLGDIDLLAAGPPCKGFSQLVNGKHDVANPHNQVLAAIPSYVAALRPRLVLIENVPGLIRHANGRTFSDLVKRLHAPGPRRLHYRVEYYVYDASLYGTPQARRRVLVLAVRNGDEHLPRPGPDLAPLYAALRHGHEISKEFLPYVRILNDKWDPRMVSARQALSDLPRLGPGCGEEMRPYSSPPQTAYQKIMRLEAPAFLSNTGTPVVRDRTLERLRHIPPGGCARSIPEPHLNGLSRRFGSAYRRLHPDAPSTALSTKYDCAYHYAYARSLSVREYARIQGIPDFVTIPDALVCRRYAYEMIGNSVPPLLVRAVLGETLLHSEEGL
jgi:DNA (cytosine-5)-methyltransferase 1